MASEIKLKAVDGLNDSRNVYWANVGGIWYVV